MAQTSARAGCKVRRIQYLTDLGVIACTPETAKTGRGAPKLYDRLNILIANICSPLVDLGASPKQLGNLAREIEEKLGTEEGAEILRAAKGGSAPVYIRLFAKTDGGWSADFVVSEIAPNGAPCIPTTLPDKRARKDNEFFALSLSRRLGAIDYNIFDFAINIRPSKIEEALEELGPSLHRVEAPKTINAILEEAAAAAEEGYDWPEGGVVRSGATDGGG